MTTSRHHFALLGHPVEHSLSPRIHLAAFAAVGLPHDYQLRDCPSEAELRDAVADVRSGVLHGANITIPHKSAVLEYVDVVDASAAEVGAANVLARAGGSVVAHNTDRQALRERFVAHQVSGGAALVLGSGGAARAAVSALIQLGMSPVLVVARRFAVDAERRAFGFSAARLLAPGQVEQALGGAPLRCVVQATSVGMSGVSGDVSAWVPWHSLPQGALALDVVYAQRDTTFLSTAAAHGLRVEGGLPMLVAQASLAWRLWLERDAPREAMLTAARGGT
ncbi:MAG: shikimate dehydrogenase [Polyangiaceae bacterium]